MADLLIPNPGLDVTLDAFDPARHQASVDDEKERKRVRARAYEAKYRTLHRDAILARGAVKRDANREKIRVSVRDSEAKRRTNNPEEYYAAKRAAYAKWKSSNPDHARKIARDIQRKIRAADPEKSRATCRKARRKWKDTDPDGYKAFKAADKARRRSANGSFSPSDITRLKALQRCKCGYCGKSLRSGFHVDHIMPLALGGSNDPKNIQLLCARCNLSKRAKHPIVFAQEIGKLL